MHKKHELIFAIVKIFFDALSVFLACSAVFFGIDELIASQAGQYGALWHVLISLLFSSSIILFSALLGAYNFENIWRINKFIPRFIASIAAVSILGFLAIRSLGAQFSINGFASIAIFSIIFALTGFYIVKKLFIVFFSNPKRGIHVLFVGYSDIANKVQEAFMSEKLGRFKPVGYVAQNEDRSSPLPYLGRLHLIEQIVSEYKPDIIMQVANSEQTINIRRIAEEYLLEHYIIPTFTNGNFATKTIMGHEFAVSSASGVVGWGHAFKRLFDLFATSFSFILLAPVFMVVAIALKIESVKDPVIASEERVDGRTGRRFKLFRFRTLKSGKSELPLMQDELKLTSGSALIDKSLGDATRLGRFLRASEINELPQLFNVIKNEMSLVGPRPPYPQEYEFFSHAHKKKHRLKPGITGLWQICKDETGGTIADSVKIDSDYVSNWTFLRDLQILFFTIPYLVRKIMKR
ncbi:MAG: undecaprenyl-phosphate glucose phosphotransferase [uncultured bacterium]|nr:MAG: undecaprenyl-phosphate glucose phosphotransferase [uncultured bacterium]HBD05695.1 hypothetical protein [Candidatus Uhrbacteria bacterium]